MAKAALSNQPPIFVGTTSTRGEWLEQCAMSLKHRAFTPIFDEAMWELGKIKFIHETFRPERFLFLHDSVVRGESAKCIEGGLQVSPVRVLPPVF